MNDDDREKVRAKLEAVDVLSKELHLLIESPFREDDPNRLPARERYGRDVHFRALVDMMRMHLHAANYTPTELREAVILAATIHAERWIPRSTFIVEGPIR